MEQHERKAAKGMWIEGLLNGTRVIDLGRPLANGMPQSSHHPRFLHTVPRRHGDVVREDGGAGANDLLVMGTHVGTHIDAIAHVSYQGRMHGGVPVGELGGVPFDRFGADQIAPILRRGVLLDVAAALDMDVYDPRHEVTPDDLEAAVELAGVDPWPGDVVLVRTGWGRHWEDPELFIGERIGTPGVGAAGARWLADLRPHAVGSDTMPFEWLPPGEVREQPVHRILIVEHGIYIIEMLVLEHLAAERTYEFLFVLLPLPIVGATGSPARPVALVRD